MLDVKSWFFGENYVFSPIRYPNANFKVHSLFAYDDSKAQPLTDPQRRNWSMQAAALAKFSGPSTISKFRGDGVVAAIYSDRNTLPLVHSGMVGSLEMNLQSSLALG